MRKILYLFFLINVLPCNCCSYDVYKDVFQITRRPRSVNEENASTKIRDTNSAKVNIISDNKPYKLGYALGKVFSPTKFKSIAKSLLPGAEVSQIFEHTEKENVQIPQMNEEVTKWYKNNLIDVKETTEPISVTLLGDQDKSLDLSIKHMETNPEKHDLNIPSIINLQSNKPSKSYETNKTLVKDTLNKFFEESDRDSNSEAYRGLKSLDGLKETKPNKKNIDDMPTILHQHFNVRILYFNIDPDKLKTEYKVQIEDINKSIITQILANENSGANVQNEVSNMLEINNTASNVRNSLKTENNDINVKSESANKTEVIDNNANNPVNISNVYYSSQGQYPQYFYKQCPQSNQNYLQDLNLQTYYKNHQNVYPYIYKGTPINVANHLSYKNENKKPQKIEVLPNVVVLGQNDKIVNQATQNRLANGLNTRVLESGGTTTSFQEDALKNPINQRYSKANSYRQPTFTNTHYGYLGIGGQSNCIVNPYLYYL